MSSTALAITPPPPPPIPPAVPAQPVVPVIGRGGPAIGDFEYMVERQPDKLKVIVQVWQFKVQGHTAMHIAELLNLNINTVATYLRWAREHLPVAHETADEFVRISLERLETMYAQLEPRRAVADPIGIKVSTQILDQAAKLLGVYSMKLDVKAEVKYSVEGINMEQV